MDRASAFEVVAGVAAVLLLLFIAERLVPLRRPRTRLWLRLLVNTGLSILTLLTALLTVRPATLATLTWTSHSSFGVIHDLPGPEWMRAVVGFLLLDATFYYWHALNHRVPFLWRFHNVHHIDPDLDVSTAFRFHFGEVLISTVFRVIQVGVIGVSLGTFMLYELVFQAGTLFHHSNLRLPIRFERVLNLLVVTPRMHGVHHSQVRDETNSNYSVVFSWWDRLHHTAVLGVSQADIVIGVPGYAQPNDNRLANTLTLPFRRQRDYWRRPDGTIPAGSDDSRRKTAMLVS